jgi:hypothetical protein
MTINIGIDLDPRVELKIRRTLGGDLLIMDHEDIDIVLMLEKGKCVAFPKEIMSDRVYSAQDRMFSFLAKKGLIYRGDIQGANVFGALEAKMMDSKVPGVDRDQAFVYSIHEYRLLQPEDDYSTELGDVPHSDRKGSQDSRVRPYGFMYNYSLVREGQGES